jgi:GTPase SAR1 family protein
MSKSYTASKSRSQGRGSWSVIFRHPVRLDPAGKPGRRVRRGLGTSDVAEADRLVGELNEILRTNELWDLAARTGAASRFDARVLEIFYDGIEPQRLDGAAVREEFVPLPGPEKDYRRVLMLGTTGAGKTTLVRQLLGTDPATERFPSTSTAKTTVADTELIFDPSPQFRAVVTFVGRDEVVDYLTECVSEAALAVFRQAGDREVYRRLLDHPNQRFRFSYILGRFGTEAANDDDVDDDDLDVGGSVELDAAARHLIESGATEKVVGAAIESLRVLVEGHADATREALVEDESDERVLEEIIEETLDEVLRGDERFHSLVDALFDEIEKRFDLLTVGDVRRNRQGWPMSWSWASENRGELLKAVTRFSSNYAPLFGSLLTPLVSGIRVAGRFAPDWIGDEPPPRLVIVDGEGLGHTPSSAAALSTSVTKRIEEVDAVVLVDNATQPMQAAPVAAMKAVVTSGNASKLLFCFTHFDLVKGDNLPTFSDREGHVRASGENVLKSIGDDLGPFAERVLRQRLEMGCFFVGGIDNVLDPAKKAGRRSIDQLSGLLGAIDSIVERPDATEVRPVYDRVNLVLAVREAATSFRSSWRGRLGVDFNPTAPKEHWTRIKALSRRFAEGWADEYDTLRPVAELKRELDEQVYRMLGQPVRWEGPDPTDDEKQQIIDEFANAIAKEIRDLSSRRIDSERHPAWQEAHSQAGTGSTFIRARIISSEIYDRAAPVPSVTPSPDQNSFLHEVTAIVDRVAEELAIGLL